MLSHSLPRLQRCLIIFAISSGVLGAMPLAQAREDRPKLENFFQNSAFTSAALSPDGRDIAMLMAPNGGRVKLAVMNIETMTPAIVAGFGDADIRQFSWLNNNRLVFDLVDRQIAQGYNYFGS